MRLCRYNDNRLGVVKGAAVHDVTTVLDRLPAVRWPFPVGDQLIEALPRLRAAFDEAAARAPGKDIASVKLLSPVANPTKIIGAPINYKEHIEESKKDQAIAYGLTL